MIVIENGIGFEIEPPVSAKITFTEKTPTDVVEVGAIIRVIPLRTTKGGNGEVTVPPLTLIAAI